MTSLVVSHSAGIFELPCCLLTNRLFVTPFGG
jgi:hypothetical protein